MGGPFNRILIVDDDRALSWSLQAILKKAGYVCHSVSSGQQAIEAVQKTPDEWNVALVDLKLPDMGGLDVLTEIRRVNPEVGFVVITGHAEIQTALAALHEGAFAYIQKPYNMEEVHHTIERLVDKQRLAQENRELLQRTIALNAELDCRVRERTTDLESANMNLMATVEELRKADAVRSEFISMINHELRTPLTVIMGAAQLLLEQHAKMAPETMHRFLSMIKVDGARLSRLVEEILDLSKIQKKGLSMRREKIDLRDIAATVVDGLRLAHPLIRFELSFATEMAELIGDEDRLKQVFVNLLQNATKYSPPDGEIRVECRRDDARVYLRIIDSGRGIEPEKRSQVFDAFYRVEDDINLQHPGTGLGLTITKAIVLAMNGTIAVEDSHGQGCVFALEFPAAPLVPARRAA